MLKQLKYFQSVVEKNSFSEAAEENFISQSAVSSRFRRWSGNWALSFWNVKPRIYSDAGRRIFLSKSLILTADYEKNVQRGRKIAKGRSGHP